MALTLPALSAVIRTLAWPLHSPRQGTVTRRQLTSNRSPQWWIGIKMLLCTCTLIQVQVQNKIKHRKERDSVRTWKIRSQIFILIMFSARHPSSSVSFHHYHHLISITLITLLFSPFTHVSVIFGHPGGSFPVSPVSLRLNKVLCASWQTGSVLSLPLRGRMSLNTGGLGTCEHKSDGISKHA